MPRGFGHHPGLRAAALEGARAIEPVLQGDELCVTVWAGYLNSFGLESHRAAGKEMAQVEEGYWEMVGFGKVSFWKWKRTIIFSKGDVFYI